MAQDLTDMDSVNIIRHKAVFVGDVSVGKTSIISRINGSDFQDHYDPTIGIDVVAKDFNFRDNLIKIQIWDSAGQERYKSLIPGYIRGSSMIFLVYDISRRETFDNLKNWIDFVKGIKSEECKMVLVGNKLDSERKVTQAEAEKLAEKENLIFFEVSAKTDENIKNMFYFSMSTMPYFEQFEEENLAVIAQELSKFKNINIVTGTRAKEGENSIIDIIKSQRELNVQDRKPTKDKNGKNCAC